MEQHSQVPNTAHLNNAKEDKKDGKINQNDPQENLDVESKGEEVSEAGWPNQGPRSSHDDGALRRSRSPLHPDAVGRKPAVDLSHQQHDGVQSGGDKSESVKASDIFRPRHDRQLSREEGDMKRFASSPLHNEIGGQKTTNSTHQEYGDTPVRVTQQNTGSDHSIEQSPLHSQARVGRKGSGVSSPSWSRKGVSEGSHFSTPGRSRLRSVTQSDETPDDSPAVPKFGDWDDTDPASAEGYSGIFTRVREERQSGAGRVPIMPTESSFSNAQRKYGKENEKGCWCIRWGK